MIDLTNNIAKQRWQQEADRIMARLERIMLPKLKAVLNKQYRNAAKYANMGYLDGVEFAVNEERLRLREVLITQYKRTATVFNKIAFENIDNALKNIEMPEIKTPKDEFWNEMNNWITLQAATKITGIQDTTKDLIAKVIGKGLKEGITHKEIAKNIRKQGLITNRWRALMIARTETHAAAVQSVDASVKSTRIEMEKEWVSAKDERVRISHLSTNGQRVPQDQPFNVGGEQLMYPGDSSLGAGAGTTINCRCVVAYHPVNRV